MRENAIHPLTLRSSLHKGYTAIDYKAISYSVFHVMIPSVRMHVPVFNHTSSSHVRTGACVKTRMSSFACN